MRIILGSGAFTFVKDMIDQFQKICFKISKETA